MFTSSLRDLMGPRRAADISAVSYGQCLHLANDPGGQPEAARQLTSCMARLYDHSKNPRSRVGSQPKTVPSLELSSIMQYGQTFPSPAILDFEEQF
jgi:hypothetical protein